MRKLIEQLNRIMGLPMVEGEAIAMLCNECGKTFKKKVGPRTTEAKCPKCGSYDTEPTGW